MFGIIIAFFASWKLSLVSLALSPILMLSGLVETAMYANRES